MRRAGCTGMLLLLALSMVSAGAAGAAFGENTAPHRTAVGAKITRCPKRNQPHGTVSIFYGSPTGGFRRARELNPFTATIVPDFQSLLFQQLFEVDDRGRLFPELAQEVPTLKNGEIRAGGKSIVVHLKRGIRWSNGAEITSQDVRFGWRVGIDPVSLGTPDCPQAFLFCLVAGIDTPDRYTAVFHLRQPAGSDLYDLQTYPWPTRWPGEWEGNPHAAALKFYASSFNFQGPSFPTDGPYQVERVDAEGRIFLRPMKYYDVMSCGGYLSRLVLTDAATLPGVISALDSRTADILPGVGLAVLPALQQHSEGYHVRVAPQVSPEHLELNLDRTYNGAANPLHDVRVRQALALALDKQTAIENAEGFTRGQARSLILWSILINTPKYKQPFADATIQGQWDPLARRYDANTGRGRALVDAKRLLAATPWKAGFSLDLYTTSGNQVRQSLVASLTADWAKLGVKVVPSYVPLESFAADWDHGGILDHGQFQVALFAWTGNVDPGGYFHHLASQYIDRLASAHSYVNANYSGVRDAQIDRAFQTANTTLQASARRNAYRLIQQRVNQMAYWVPLLALPYIYLDNGRVRNLSYSPASVSGNFWNTWAWRVSGS